MPRYPLTWERGRVSPRAGWHDYTQPGWYFVTVCTQRREPIFGAVDGGDLVLNQCGQVVAGCWQRLPELYPRVRLDAWVLMPNHLHGIIRLLPSAAPVPPGLSGGVGAFKSESARHVNRLRGTRGVPVWQRSFHDEMIRDGAHLSNIRVYIAANPANWHADEHHPAAEPAPTIRVNHPPRHSAERRS